jgi:hypothetical protein
MASGELHKTKVLLTVSAAGAFLMLSELATVAEERMKAAVPTVRWLTLCLGRRRIVHALTGGMGSARRDPRVSSVGLIRTSGFPLGRRRAHGSTKTAGPIVSSRANPEDRVPANDNSTMADALALPGLRQPPE